MRRSIALLLAASTLVGCVSARPGGQGGGGSGVRGAVTAGPQCPVESAASPCPDVPWLGTVRATRGGERVDVVTDDRGRFSMQLSPGRWTIEPVIRDGAPPSFRPVTVTIPAHRYVRIHLTVDTGIR